MLKNFIISFLGAALLIEHIPWSVDLTSGARIAIEAGWTSTLIIFCLFCDKMAAKWRNYRGESGKNPENHGQAGRQGRKCMTEMEIYTERIRGMTDEALKKEWEHPAAEYFAEGACLRKVEHEMAMRFMGRSRQQRSVSEERSHYLKKYMELPGQFWEAYSRKDWPRAKMIYEDAIRIGLFLELPEEVRTRVLGSRQDPDNIIEGMIPDAAVHKVMHECVIKNRLGHECIVYRVPGEIGFYGARYLSGTRYMEAEENPAYYAGEVS